VKSKDPTTPEKLEAKRAAAQEFIDTAELLMEEEQALKEKYTEADFHDWSRRDFQQFICALENHGCVFYPLLCQVKH
jgi:SWI/SNF-related matrix-associated actin-dependent regulator of chromatin subfamily A member 5